MNAAAINPQSATSPPTITTPLPVDRLKSRSGIKFYFTKEEVNVCVMFLKTHRTRSASGGHKAHFEELLDFIGFSNSTVASEKELMDLRKHVQDKLYGLWKLMTSYGAITRTHTDHRGRVVLLDFAQWTDAWLQEDWDGSLKAPGSADVDEDEEDDDDDDQESAEEEDDNGGGGEEEA